MLFVKTIVVDYVSFTKFLRVCIVLKSQQPAIFVNSQIMSKTKYNFADWHFELIKFIDLGLIDTICDKYMNTNSAMPCLSIT